MQLYHSSNEQLCKEYLNTLLKNINHRDTFQDQIDSYSLIFVHEYYTITMYYYYIYEYIRECLHALLPGRAIKSKTPGDLQESTTTTTALLLHITLRVYTDFKINTIIIMELQREICEKYKSNTVSEKKAILEETKVSSTREVILLN